MLRKNFFGYLIVYNTVYTENIFLQFSKECLINITCIQCRSSHVYYPFPPIFQCGTLPGGSKSHGGNSADWPPPPQQQPQHFPPPPPTNRIGAAGNSGQSAADNYFQQGQQQHHIPRGGTLGRHPSGRQGFVDCHGGVLKPGGVPVSPYPLYHTCERQKKRVTIVEDNNTESSV